MNFAALKDTKLLRGPIFANAKHHSYNLNGNNSYFCFVLFRTQLDRPLPMSALTRLHRSMGRFMTIAAVKRGAMESRT